MLLVVMEVGTRNLDLYLVPVTGVREDQHIALPPEHVHVAQKELRGAHEAAKPFLYACFRIFKFFQYSHKLFCYSAFQPLDGKVSHLDGSFLLAYLCFERCNLPLQLFYRRSALTLVVQLCLKLFHLLLQFRRACLFAPIVPAEVLKKYLYRNVQILIPRCHGYPPA